MKQHCFDTSSQLVLKLKTFEDFKERVLSALEDWDLKALEITDLSQKYYSELEENRRLFLSMRQLIKDKDVLIANLQRTSKAKDQNLHVAQGEARKELERQNYLIRSELLEQIKMLQMKVQQYSDQRAQADIRYASFKLEFSKMLEEREQVKELNMRLQQEIESQTQELVLLKQENLDFLQRLRLISSSGGHHISQGMVGMRNSSASEVMHDLELMMDELRIRRDET